MVVEEGGGVFSDEITFLLSFSKEDEEWCLESVLVRSDVSDAASIRCVDDGDKEDRDNDAEDVFLLRFLPFLSCNL